MNYDEVVDQIDSTVKFGCKPGLERTEKLLELLGNPHKKLRAIHVAGTNGKGSTAAMIASILSNAGYRTGMYISPHLFRNTERMTINGIEITEEDFAEYAMQVLSMVRLMGQKGLEEPTQFEMYTAMAFLYFERKKVDFAVVEVGLGGRFDATNVIEPLLSVITSISYDHKDVLGDTIEKIAYEKAGIIKEGSKAVMYPQPYPEASAVIEAVCREKNASLVVADIGSLTLKDYDLNGQTVDFKYRNYDIRGMKLPLIGDHQLYNAAVALTAIAELDEMGNRIEEEGIRKGIESVKWPCRMSIESIEPLILIDGAHNEDGIDSLHNALMKYFSSRKIIFVFGMLKDKDYTYAIRKLMPMAYHVIAAEPLNKRALSASAMAEAVKPYCSRVVAEPDIIKAIERAKNLYEKDCVICICGSLYLAGRAYEYLMEKTDT
ncbi:MAG TPA: folylpolyglutamate synthase/dihydrofolate synthase family protein [Bacillota bacterium]|jgi:dihydrofolate synthase/folylpolyglutamate synthase|nr:folylpolyglutamate synthase/dihydrofolate synthase family protein [Bacillota bacterium]HQL35421.1 folylpolyglutamate synthase/dihydrofolate synthase family protein [Bacillota bacterium]HRS20697.1 folylpolyglutamate synthase/dihydrofolate synthase family protein [Clostridia bacterium]